MSWPIRDSLSNLDYIGGQASSHVTRPIGVGDIGASHEATEAEQRGGAKQVKIEHMDGSSHRGERINIEAWTGAAARAALSRLGLLATRTCRIWLGHTQS